MTLTEPGAITPLRSSRRLPRARHGLVDRPDLSRSLTGGWVWALVTCGVTVLFIVAAATRLNRESLWTDETRNLAFAADDRPGAMARIWLEEPTAGLYRSLLRAWISVMGTGTVAVRTFSLACAAITIGLLLAIVVRLASPQVAVLAVLFFGTNASVLAYSAEAGAYALSMMLTTACLLCVSVGSSTVTGRTASLAAGVLGAAAVHAHPFSAVPIVLVLAVVPLTRPGPARWSEGPARSAVVLGLGCLPLLVLVLRSGLPPLAWIREQPAPFTSTLTFWTGEQPRWLPALLVTASVVMLLAWLRRAVLIGDWRRRPVVPLALAWVWGPIVMLAAVAVVLPLLVPRATVAVLPGVALVVAAAVALIRPWFVRLVVISAVVVLQLSGIVAPRADHGGQDWRKVVAVMPSAAVDAGAVPVVVLDPDDVLPLTYYLSGARHLRSVASTTPGDRWFGLSAAGAPASHAFDPATQTFWLVGDAADLSRGPTAAMEDRPTLARAAAAFTPTPVAQVSGRSIWLYRR